MTLSTIGPYRVLEKLGEGGMGEVYRARDTRLDRDVAIKILPGLFSSDADRLARFEREARTLASLNHPNIAQVYGVEPHEGARALVMELVEGADLSDRIARGPIPVAEALPIARQIAAALEAAHERGVIHRDLKPANIKVRDDGTVKVLDFGLAKALDPVGTSSAALMNSPTITSPATQPGMILGTAAYMAPEQAKGKAADRRADVWAFGVVLFEMLTARRPFGGDDVTEVLASVLKDSPPHDALPGDTPPAVRRLIRRSLEKDRSRRLDSMAVARFEIDDALGSPDESHQASGTPVGLSRGRATAVIALVAIAAAVLGAGAVWRMRPPAAAPAVRLSITPLPGHTVRLEPNHHDMAIARDGSRIVYWGNDPRGATKLFMRSLAGFDTQVIDPAPDARGMFFSHDGAWIGFQAGTTSRDALLMKMSLDGGRPTRIATIDGNLRGATWAADDTILYATHRQGSGLFRVRASGGAPEVLTTPDEAAGELDHVWPALLPGGTHALFAIRREGSADIGLVDLRSRTWRVLIPDGTMPSYAASGHVVHASKGILFATRFDLGRMATTGGAVRMLDGVVTKDWGAADYALAENGTLAYVPGGAASPRQTLAWIDRRGRREPIAAEPRPYRAISISPDGAKAAVTIEEDVSTGLWTVDLERFTLTRLTPPGMSVGTAVWSPDSRSIAFGGWPAATTGGGIHRVVATGTAPPELLAPNPPAFRRNVTDWTDAGGILIVDGIAGSTALSRVEVASRQVTTVLNTPGDDTGGRVSPNGRWLAYASNETGRPEVYVRPYPNVNDDRIAVTSAGAGNPVWRADGRELIARDLSGSLLSIAVTYAGTKIQLGQPEPISAITGLPRTSPLSASPDASRFLMAVRAEVDTSVDEYRVILNWLDELRSRVK